MKNPVSAIGKVDRWTATFLAVAAVVIAGLLLSALWPRSPDGNGPADPATVEAIPGTNRSQLTLTEDAAHSLGIQTVKIADVMVAGKQMTVVPYSALLYEPNGTTGVYTQTEPLVYVRQPVTVDHIDGDRVLLKAGPPAGTAVVTVGSPELHGIEYGVGEE